MTDNLALWESVQKTDPAHTKKITGKSYDGNSPKPHWIVHSATKAFGPIGIGWGYEIIDERLVDGAMIEVGFYEKIHFARVKVWYKWNGERGEVEHVGGTVFSGKRANGKLFSDDDAGKKSVTDALVKALSMIGFAGDIFLGRFDDSKYVEEVRAEFKEQKESDSPEASLSQYIASFRKKLAACKTRADIAPLWKAEAPAREFLNLVEASHAWQELYLAWTSRGKEIAANSHIRTEAA